jgi:hypothetical protein
MDNDQIVAQEGASSSPDSELLVAQLRLIDELRGSTAGGPSMCDMLLEERRRDRELELAKDGW